MPRQDDSSINFSIEFGYVSPLSDGTFVGYATTTYRTGAFNFDGWRGRDGRIERERLATLIEYHQATYT